MNNNNIESILRGMETPKLHDQRKEQLKNRILAQVGTTKESLLISSIQKLKPVLLERKKQSIWAGINAKLDSSVAGLFSFLFYPKRVIGGVMVFTLVFTLFNFVEVENRVAMAEEFTVLQEFSGEVRVMRDGEIIMGRKNMKLMEKDAVVTGENGYASIVFFDDSVSRLSRNTSVTLSRLSLDIQKESRVQVDLGNGVLWTRVLNLVDGDSTFTVKVDGFLAEADKKAAFNIERTGNNSEFQVYNNSIQLKDLKNSKEEKLKTGQKAVVAEEKIRLATIDEKEKKLSWVKDNLKDDVRYVAEVKQKSLEDKREKVEISFKNASLLLSFDDVRDEKSQIDILETELIKAELNTQDEEVSDEDIIAFNSALKNFKAGVNNFYGIIDEVAEKDPKYASELRIFINEKLKNRRKEFLLATPDSTVFEVKQAYNDLLAEGIKDSDQKAMVRYEQAQEELSEALERFETGDKEVAEIYLEKYVEGLNKVRATVESSNSASKNLIVEMNEDVAILKQLEDKSDTLVSTVDTIEKTRDSLTVKDESTAVTRIVPVLQPGVEPSAENSETTSTPYGVEIEGDKPLPPL